MGAHVSTCERYRYQLDRRWDVTALALMVRADQSFTPWPVEPAT